MIIRFTSDLSKKIRSLEKKVAKKLCVDKASLCYSTPASTGKNYSCLEFETEEDNTYAELTFLDLKIGFDYMVDHYLYHDNVIWIKNGRSFVDKFDEE